MLKEAVNSALIQGYSNFEVLIVDDGSNDEIKAWLLNAAEQHDHLRVIFQNHQGVAIARARGVAEAYGELVCILDSDDLLAPHALELLTEEFKKHPQTQLVYSYIRELRPTGSAVDITYPDFKTVRDMLYAILLRPRLPFKHSGTMFCRDTAVALGSYDQDLPCKIDIDFYLKFLRANHLPCLVHEHLVSFRMHRNSVSRNRMLGIHVWCQLIDRYGPSNLLVRFGIKTLRFFSELLKLAYIKVHG